MVGRTAYRSDISKKGSICPGSSLREEAGSTLASAVLWPAQIHFPSISVLTEDSARRLRFNCKSCPTLTQRSG